MLFTVVLSSIGQCFAILLNGFGKIKSQVILGALAGGANIFLSFVLGNIIGINGVAWATNICLITFSIVLVGIDVLKNLRLIQ